MINKMNKKDPLDQELSTMDSTDGGILARLWTLVKYETKMHTLLKVFLDKYKERGGKRSPSTILGYFTATNMSWKTFVFLIFEILPVKKMTITVELTFVDNTKSSHSTDIAPNDIDRNTDVEKDLLTNLKKYIVKDNINEK